jgi:tRNA threonylcarbamoyladenosine dehydratase
MSDFDFLARTEALLGSKALEKLAGATVAVAGVGGVGGSVALTLARLGIGGLTLADPGLFDLPDLNRQAAAFRSTTGRNKAEVYAEMLPAINPALRLRVYPQGVTQENVGEFLEGADVVVDALDVNVPATVRLAFYREIRRRAQYVILPPIVGFGTVVAIAAPDGEPMDRFLALLSRAVKDGTLPPGLLGVFHPEVIGCMQGHMRKGIVPSLALGPSLAAAVTAAEMSMIICRGAFPGWREPVVLPQVILLDLAQLRCRVVSVDELAGP